MRRVAHRCWLPAPEEAVELLVRVGSRWRLWCVLEILLGWLVILVMAWRAPVAPWHLGGHILPFWGFLNVFATGVTAGVWSKVGAWGRTTAISRDADVVLREVAFARVVAASFLVGFGTGLFWFASVSLTVLLAWS